MRITDNTRLIAVLRSNAAGAGRLTLAARRASAGARVSAPSDDPSRYSTAVRRGSTLANIESRARTARAAADELTIAERALDAATGLVAEAKSLAVQGANETLSPQDRQALSQRTLGVREQLLELANTRGGSGYVFAGSRTDTAPFDAGGTFLGNDVILRVPVTDGVAPKMNVSGARGFTAAGGRDVFADLTALATALGAGDLSGIRDSITNLQGGHDQLVAVQVDAGLTIERLRSSADVLEGASVTIAESRARDLGADDLAGLATELSAASSAYEYGLEVTRRLLALPSLATV